MSNLFTESPSLENSKRRNVVLPGRYRLQVRRLAGELLNCLDETISLRPGGFLPRHNRERKVASFYAAGI
jgi:hypothetical protein